MKKILFFVFALVINYSLFINHCESQWVLTSFDGDTNIKDIEATDSNVYVSYLQSGIYRSNCSGNNAITINNGIPGLLQIPCLKLKDNIIYAGNIYDGIYKSSNNGQIWFSINDNNTNTLCVYDIDKFNQNLFIGTSSGVFMSTNEGLNWISIKNNLPINYVAVVFYNANKIFAGGFYEGLYTSTNLGTNWLKCQNGFPDSCYVTDYSIMNNTLFISTIQNGIYKSSDNGTSWINCSSGLSNSVISICSYSNILFAGRTSWGVYFSSNYGQTWNAINNNGLTQYFDMSKIKTNSQYLFAGTYSSGVWRRSLSEIIGIKKITEVVSSKYSLQQNYPNPFNSNSKIKIENAKLGNVKLVVYDMIGREVEMLVNERLQPGIYEVNFDGSNFNSGVYFYKLSTNSFSDVKKMILLK